MEKLNENINKGNMNPSFLASLKVIIVEWFLSSTAHALPNIFRTGNIVLKVMWLCCFLASLGFSLYIVIQSLLSFLTYSTNVSTGIVQEIPTQFPAVTICNLKTVNKTSALNYFNTSIPTMNSTQAPSPFFYIISQIYMTRASISRMTNLTATGKKLMGYDLKSMLVSCMFNYNPCDENDFTYYYDPLYGNCYTFNKGVNSNGTATDIKTISVTGPLYGLVLELFVGNPKIETKYEFNDGVLISLHNQTSAPFVDGDKIMAPTGADTDIIITRNFYSKLAQPYSTCLMNISKTSDFSSYYFDYIVKTRGLTYTQRYCFSLCIQNQILKTCNCSNAFMPTFDNPQYCDTDPTIGCIVNLVGTFGKSAANDECKAACPLECNRVEYATTSSRAYYPNDFYRDVLAANSKIKASNISLEDINKAVAKVNLYYKSMDYNSIVETAAMDTPTFVSNLGGTLGLFLGISVLSLVEVVELSFNLIIALMSYRKQKKQVIQMQLQTMNPSLESLNSSTINFIQKNAEAQVTPVIN